VRVFIVQTAFDGARLLHGGQCRSGIAVGLVDDGQRIPGLHAITRATLGHRGDGFADRSDTLCTLAQREINLADMALRDRAVAGRAVRHQHAVRTAQSVERKIEAADALRGDARVADGHRFEPRQTAPRHRFGKGAPAMHQARVGQGAVGRVQFLRIECAALGGDE
jgi:hypothetical protein